MITSSGPSRRRASRFPSVLSAAACAVAVLAGCGTQHVAPRPDAPRTQRPSSAGPSPAGAAPAGASPRQRAVADAARIIASFPRPPGAVRTGAVRTGLIESLSAPGEGPPDAPDVATATRWWRAPGRPQAVLAWVRAHLPPGFTLAGTGTGTYRPGPSAAALSESWTDQFALPAVPGVLTERWLVVLAVPDGGQTAIRADAQVVWLPARPAAERIPADARAVTVTPVFGDQAGKARERLDRAVTVTDPAKVAGVAALIDGLDRFPPGVANCPADFGAAIRLTFLASPHGRVVAVLVAGYAGCGVVSVTIRGRSMPALSDYTQSGQRLQDRVLAIAGVRWPYSPGTPPGAAG